MAGKIKELVGRLIKLRVKDDPHMIAPFKIKLIMKGVDPDLYNETSDDDPVVIQRIHQIAKSMGYEL